MLQHAFNFHSYLNLSLHNTETHHPRPAPRLSPRLKHPARSQPAIPDPQDELRQIKRAFVHRMNEYGMMQEAWDFIEMIEEHTSSQDFAANPALGEWRVLLSNAEGALTGGEDAGGCVSHAPQEAGSRRRLYEKKCTGAKQMRSVHRAQRQRQHQIRQLGRHPTQHLARAEEVID
eukprot:TRINITY_DN604_c0_g1_i2.p1 TRINITY_DN604_c0_g1~~TRINITY_DN604_c0_g1_i2.p1  ORF type:complete len:175 (+),score=27.30 TRINITY_DN604_c0_g1_i2:204-728(+)